MHHACAGVLRRVSDHLELDLQAVVRGLMWGLEAELGLWQEQLGLLTDELSLHTSQYF